MTFADQVRGLVCPLCRGFLRLSFPVDSDGNWLRSTPEKDASDPYCGNCGEHVVPVPSKRKRKVSKEVV